MSADTVGAVQPGQQSPFFAPASPSQPPPSTTPGIKARIAAVSGLDRSQLTAASKDDIQNVLESLFGALTNLPPAELQGGERHDDGGLRITSHLAVWLISKLTTAYGAQLVKLSRVSDRECLRSTSGLARLLTDAIAKAEGTPA